ncbi:LysR family transcriptional regulator [Aquamicrobium zhengzhouense]|uniref:LysR family transcriptional regulator n=1 Tax=Aquamicrobium zhengzhouense TaxID=2781738 RepID=A0ABS0SHH1_9HYPH|nr:LysR family transcriptional regulator [Aquamicrobium zhengzhouense]MBI1622752.1 LysR family transcriptional regulator [Aquamicrobium zhengzhouense]
MELRQLKYLLSAVECGSLGKAAAQLGVATSALSQQISRLESELSTRILVRSASGVTPTEAGTLFCQHATLALRHIDAAVEAAQGARLTGVVSLGLAPTTSSILALPLIQAMNRRYPDIRLQLVEGMSGHLSGMLKARQIDLAVLFGPDNSSASRDMTPLLDETLFLIGRSELLQQANIAAGTGDLSLRQIASLPVILPSRGHGLRDSLDRAFANAECRPEIQMEIDSLAVIMEVVSAGLGVTIQPGAALTRAPAKKLAFVPLTTSEVRRSNVLVSLPDHELAPAALALRAQLRKVVAKLVRDGRWLGAVLHESV